MWKDISQRLREGMDVWPGDEAFRRTPSMKQSDGASVNTSVLHMSTHTGTHLDAPYHYSSRGRTIDQMDVNELSGICRLIELKNVPVISASDLAAHGPFNESIILFKTTDTVHSYDSFPVFSKEAVELLHSEGVRLLGTDAPSVDSLTSKDLPAHHACLQSDIYIVEGLRLADAEPGFYEFMALPLLLEGSDGSPVRAVIREVD
ncbi:cyclase family protein [Alkalicoccus urumqiensis]|uniref:Kynurenine formamidase n=1 Tax=Alkalicoccus urumqiensis TaxID=1548213 RepID=A0A2P6MKQ8_ALKUR|nr:cyclase family protein [Alkalicoccus urumqiensis]PRO66858.1 hypothetical protein C6I21_02740 [Alkalicoccus urumqiensis]